MSDLISKIRSAQIRAGEDAVCDHLRKMGLIDDQNTVAGVHLTALELADEHDAYDDVPQAKEVAAMLRSQAAEIDRLIAERDSAEKCCSMLSRINGGIILAMQAAWIAHQYGKEPADSVMEWIANSLDGPGLLPGPGDDGFTTDAQAWFDAQIAERPDDGIVHAAKICPNCDTDLPDGFGGLFENDHDCMLRNP